MTSRTTPRALQLAIARVLHFNPVWGRLLRYAVRRTLPLAHHSFQLQFANLLEQQPAIILDMIEVEDA
jgi:hypothetical protein